MLLCVVHETVLTFEFKYYHIGKEVVFSVASVCLFVCLSFCLFVCLSLSKITQKVMNRLQ